MIMILLYYLFVFTFSGRPDDPRGLSSTPVITTMLLYTPNNDKLSCRRALITLRGVLYTELEYNIMRLVGRELVALS